MSFVTTCINLDIILNEIGQACNTNTNILSCHIYVELKIIDLIKIEIRIIVMRK